MWTDQTRSLPRRAPTAGVLAPRERPEWMDEGACKKKVDLFFPGEGALDDVLAAKYICNTVCPVRSECLAYALRFEEKHGVWGGTSADERIRMLRKQRAS